MNFLYSQPQITATLPACPHLLGRNINIEDQYDLTFSLVYLFVYSFCDIAPVIDATRQ